MITHLALLSIPVVLGLLTRLLRRPRPKSETLSRDIRDLVTLHMVLRDSGPEQRGELLAAHRDWRTEPAKRDDVLTTQPASSPAVTPTRPTS